jgi:hypothetical protein
VQERADQAQERADLAQEAADIAQEEAVEEQDRADEAQELADEARELVDEARELADEAAALAEERGFAGDRGAGREYDRRSSDGSRPDARVIGFDRAEEISERFDRFRQRTSAMLAVVGEEWERAFGNRRQS